MSNAHTPGPWACISGARGGKSTVYLPADGMVICSRNQYEDKHAEFLANARLIASAPELLEALRDMLAGWKYIRSTHGYLYGVGWDRAQVKAEEAMAKATGAQQ